MVGRIDGRAGTRDGVLVGERDEGDAQVDGLLEPLAPGARTLGSPGIRAAGRRGCATRGARLASHPRGRIRYGAWGEHAFARLRIGPDGTHVLQAELQD